MKCTDKIHAASELNIISVLRRVLIVLRHWEISPRQETVAYYRHCNLRFLRTKLEMFLLVFNERQWLHLQYCTFSLHSIPAGVHMG